MQSRHVTSRLRGPKHSYPAPTHMKGFAFQLGVLYLDKDGGPKRGDHFQANQQMIPILYNKELCEALEDSDDSIFTGRASPFKHPELRVNLKGHDNGIRFFIVCTNDNEQLMGQILFRSDWTRNRLETLLLEGTESTQDGVVLTVPGDCPMSNNGSDKMALRITVDQGKTNMYISSVWFRVDADFFDQWEERCKA